ncbi:MAG: class I SAM-dependent methyltransferase, partial [Chloroflexi bacterium]|nr:class I SAM-dependent methyltransferase [Chloroflexota bacterium]
MTNAQPDRSSQSQFGRLAGAYGASKTHAQAGALASAASMLGDRRYGTAMDIGAGPGFTAFAVADHCDRIVATDVTPEMLEQARSLRGERGAPQTELMLTAAESLPCRDGSLDLITCRTAAHHFLNVDSWLAEVHRALAPGGELILIDTISPDDAQATSWMHDIEIWRDPSHVRNLTEAEWVDAIERAGLRVAETAISRVDLEYPDWTERAGMAKEEAVRLGRALKDAPPAAAGAFGIASRADGTIEFYWPIL